MSVSNTLSPGWIIVIIIGILAVIIIGIWYFVIRKPGNTIVWIPKKNYAYYETNHVQPESKEDLYESNLEEQKYIEQHDLEDFYERTYKNKEIDFSTFLENYKIQQSL